jgi:hypothetical protein
MLNIEVEPMMRKSLIIMTLFGLTITPLHADVIQIPVGQQAAELAQLKRPATGMTKARVLQEFGEPIERKAPRGTPPISSWEYEHFIVYFENDHVIHSVLKHRPQNESSR